MFNLTYRTPLHRPDSLTQQLLTMWACDSATRVRDMLDIMELDIAERAIDHNIPHPFIF